MSSSIIITNYQSKFARDVREICYRTGYMGRDLSELEYFNDKVLFTTIFCNYYLKYEKDNNFVAIDKEDNKVIGYIIGSLNTMKTKTQFKSSMIPSIVKRLIFVTSWKYPRSFIQTLKFTRSVNTITQSIINKYPAHFHINILPGYQGMGLGTKLMDRFENYVRENGIEGIHLSTSSNNKNALWFYKSRGYQIVKRSRKDLWSLNNVQKITMGKTLY